MRMRRLVNLLLLALLSMFQAPSLAAVPGAVPPAVDMAFVGAHVIPMTGPWTLDAHTVIVRDGVIVAVGPSDEVRPAESDVVVDASDHVLMPGLAEMHAHVPSTRTAGMPDGYQQDVLTLFVANGVTLARGMLGEPDHLALRDAIARHEVLGPELVTSGPSLNGRSVRSAEQARRRVEAQAQAGYDFLKLHPGLAPDTFAAIAEAAKAAQIPFAGHVSTEVGLERTLAAGQITIDHLDGYFPLLLPEAERDRAEAFFGLEAGHLAEAERIQALVDMTRASGAWVVPTETLMENMANARIDPDAALGRPENAYLPTPLRERYRRTLEEAARTSFDGAAFLDMRKRLIAALHRGGVPILLGSDAPQIMNVPGFSLHRELEAMVTAGLHPMEALETGTANPARFLGREGATGTIVAGADANFVLLRENPVVDIRRTRSIEGVMLRGRWLDRQDLDARLADIRTRYGAPAP